MLSGWLRVMELILHAASVWTLLPASEFIAPSGGSVFPAQGLSTLPRMSSEDSVTIWWGCGVSSC